MSAIGPVVSRVLASGLGSRVVAVHAEEFDYFTSHPLYALDLEFADGRRVRALAKDTARPHPARPDAPGGRSSEQLMYERLLGRANGSAPRFFGAAGSLLVLEFVEGSVLWQEDGVDAWLSVARSLRSLHGSLAEACRRFPSPLRPRLVRDLARPSAEVRWPTALGGPSSRDRCPVPARSAAGRHPRRAVPVERPRLGPTGVHRRLGDRSSRACGSRRRGARVGMGRERARCHSQCLRRARSLCATQRPPPSRAALARMVPGLDGAPRASRRLGVGGRKRCATPRGGVRMTSTAFGDEPLLTSAHRFGRSSSTPTTSGGATASTGVCSRHTTTGS